MKIAIIYDAIYPYVIGGGEKRIYEIGKRLSSHHEIHLFGMKYWKGKNVIKKNSLYLHGVCKPLNLYQNGRRSFFQPFYFSFYLAKNLFRHDLDLIDCQNFPFIPCFVSKLYSLVKKKPLIITWLEIWNKDLWKNLGFFGYLGSWIEGLSFKLTNKNIALTSKISTKLDRGYVVIPSGIDIGKIRKVKPKKEKYDILFAGRLIKEKNIDLLLRAVIGLNLNLCIIGNGPEGRNLKKLVKKLKLKNVKFFDFFEKDENIYAYMKSSKILVLPSVREGFGTIVIEALVCGCKIISTNHEGNHARFLVDDNFICNVNVGSLKQKIEFALKNPYNNKINLENYDIKIVAKDIEKYYLRCINEI